MLKTKEVWSARREGLITYLRDFKRFYDPLGVDEMDTWQEIVWALMNCLDVFLQKQANFFIEGFANGQLESHPNFSPESTLNIIIDQIGFDIEIMEKIARQRGTKFNKFLTEVDCLVWKALDLAIAHKLLEQKPIILTYFQKSTSIRVIPYAPIILVGIPYSCIHNERDLLAIPHEVGHYVYRLGKHNNQSLFAWAASMIETANNASEVIPSWAENWIEEIFADVYGALTAGLVMALDFQDLQKRRTLEQFYKDDGEHPTPLLRPFIYQNTLLAVDPNNETQWMEKLNQDWLAHLSLRKSDLEDLDEEWAIGLRGESDKFETYERKLKTVTEAITTGGEIKESQKPIDYIVKSILNDLLPAKTYGNWAPNFKDETTNDLESLPDHEILHQELEALYLAFVKWYESEKEDRACTDNIATLKWREADTQLKLNDNPVGHNIGHTGLPMDEVRNRLETLSNNKTIPAKGKGEGWLLVLDAGGWTVKGPDCEATGGVCAG
ncbi:MAG: hypothetical protein CL608_22305 [Anaerolineaceae bacterium]|nr:hypothetical protein [Anaerolineaceae bacterium]